MTITEYIWSRISPYTPPRYTRAQRRELAETRVLFEKLRANGLLTIVGARHGAPVYGITETGRRELAERDQRFLDSFE